MRCLLVSVFTISVVHLACGRTALDMAEPGNVFCQTDESCPSGTTCASGTCVFPDDNPSAGSGAGGRAGGSWGGAREPASGGAGGNPSTPGPSSGGRASGPAGSPAGAGAVAGMSATGGLSAGNPASRSGSLGGQPGPGSTSKGGRSSMAGTTSILGGSGGTGRTSSSSSRPNGEVTFYSGGAQGRLLSGAGWVGMGNDDSISSPLCDTGQPITNAMPCTTVTKWSTLDSLCMSGSVPALPGSPVQADYDNNWGVEIGVNAKEPPDAVGLAMSAFSTVTFTYSGTPKSGVRAFVHRKGDPDGVTYCFDSIASAKTISLTKFNTKCWGDAATVFLTSPDLSHIDKIGLMVPSTTAVAITVNNFCLERIVFN